MLDIYTKFYKNTKTIFTVGLMFLCVGYCYIIIAVHAYFAMEQLYATGLVSFFVGIHITE